MSRPSVPADHVTPYDRFCWSDVDVERMLVSGAQRQALTAYFGEGEYRVLVRLARAAQRARTDESLPHVFLIPGILGSQLGLRRRAPLPDDVLWLDPLDIQSGRLTLLSPEGGAAIVPLGTMLYSHLRLKLHLRARGFAVTLYDYDWRLDLTVSAAAFAETLRAHGPCRAAIVAHSMGGLVSRAALALPGTAHVERAVLLGTPNLGAFAPLQALRGSYAVVRNIARLDRRHTAEELAVQIFSGFPSLYQMLPAPRDGLDLLDRTQWPRFGPAPRRDLLELARRFRASLLAPDGRFTTIAGVGQKTVTAVSRRRDGFLYTITRSGDGTVPTASAAPPGAHAYFTPVAHSELTRDNRVVAAVVDLLRSGVTRRLPERWVTRSRAQARISDRRLYALRTDKLDWARMSAADRQAFLENLNEPPSLPLRVPRRGTR